MAKILKRYIELTHTDVESLFATNISIEFNDPTNIKSYIDSIDSTSSNIFSFGNQNFDGTKYIYFNDSSYLSYFRDAIEELRYFTLSDSLAISGNLSVNTITASILNVSEVVASSFVEINGSLAVTENTTSLENYYTSSSTDSLLAGKSNTNHNHYLVSLLDVDINNTDNGSILYFFNDDVTSGPITNILPSNIVYTNTAQTISGNKTFSGLGNTLSGTLNVTGNTNITTGNLSVSDLGSFLINNMEIYYNGGWFTTHKYDVLSGPFIFSGSPPFIPDPRVVGQLDARVALEGVTELGDLKDVMIRSTNKTHGKDLSGGNSYEANFLKPDQDMNGRVLMYLDTPFSSGGVDSYFKGWYPISINPTIDDNPGGDIEITINPNITGTTHHSFTINTNESSVTSLFFSNDPNKGALVWNPSDYGYESNDSSFELNDDIFIFGDVTTFGLFRGDGSEIENINASNISSGTLDNARLSSNVPLKNTTNIFTGNNTFDVNAGSITIAAVSMFNPILQFSHSAQITNATITFIGYADSIQVNKSFSSTGLISASSGFSGSGASITNIPISGVVNLQNSLNSKANLSGANFTGNITVTSAQASIKITSTDGSSTSKLTFNSASTDRWETKAYSSGNFVIAADLVSSYDVLLAEPGVNGGLLYRSRGNGLHQFTNSEVLSLSISASSINLYKSVNIIPSSGAGVIRFTTSSVNRWDLKVYGSGNFVVSDLSSVSYDRFLLGYGSNGGTLIKATGSGVHEFTNSDSLSLSISSSTISTGRNLVFSGTQMLMNASGRSTINFGNHGGGVSAPNTSAAGLKIKLYGATGDNTISTGEYGIGIQSGNMYHVSGGGYMWYSSSSLTNLAMHLDSSNNLNLYNNISVSGSATFGIIIIDPVNSRIGRTTNGTIDITSYSNGSNPGIRSYYSASAASRSVSIGARLQVGNSFSAITSGASIQTDTVAATNNINTNGLAVRVRAINSNTTLGLNDYFLHLNMISGDRTVTLPTATAPVGTCYFATIIDRDSSGTYQITFDAGSGNNIHGPGIYSQTASYSALNNHKWFFIVKISATTWSLDTNF